MVVERMSVTKTPEPGLSLQSARERCVLVVHPADAERALNEAADLRDGLSVLYVALTRATRHLSIVHAEPLPPAMLEPSAQVAS